MVASTGAMLLTLAMVSVLQLYTRWIAPSGQTANTVAMANLSIKDICK